MSEEEIIDIIKPFQTNYEELDGAKDIKISIEEYQAILGLLDLYNQEKEKKERLIQRTINYDKTLEHLQKDTISKDKISKKAEEYKNMLDNLNKNTDLDRIKAINERIIVLKEILEE